MVPEVELTAWKQCPAIDDTMKHIKVLEACPQVDPCIFPGVLRPR